MTYLPAPYESPQQDDLPRRSPPILTTTVGLITSWVLGQHAYPVDQGVHRRRDGQSDFRAGGCLAPPSVDTVLVSRPSGWAIAAVLMVIGSLLLLFRRGRGLLIFGALIAIATTAWAQFGLGYGGEGAAIPVESVAAVLGRRRRARAGPAAGDRTLGAGAAAESRRQSTVIGTTESGAILWPGM